MSGREKGLMRANTGTGHVDMSHYKLLMDTQSEQTQVKTEAVRENTTTEPRRYETRTDAAN